MNLSNLLELIDYHYWARDRILDAAEKLTPEQYIKDLGSSFRSVRDTLVHVYSAEWAWYSRWVGESPTAHLSPHDFPDVSTLEAAWTVQEVQVRTFVKQIGEDGVERRLDYRMMNGTPGVSSFREMVQHVVNHATYHRGQVTTMLRQLGAEPPRSMDLVAYYREIRA